MHLDVAIALAGLFVGFTVGLTGMGGGALMTPILVLFFGLQPLAAVSSDLVASFVMKPIGAGVHLRKGTVELDLVKWLVVGSCPAAFSGVLVLRALGTGERMQGVVRVALGVALLAATGAIVARAVLRVRARRRLAQRPASVAKSRPARLVVRPLPTVMVGAVGGLVVGMTSVGSGSLIIVALMLMYPSLASSRLVGTDLAQAVPLVGSAALGHLLFGQFQLAVTSSLLVGAIPGVYVGARASALAPGGVVRRALLLVLLASGLKLVHVDTTAMLLLVAGALVAMPFATAWLRKARIPVPARLPATARPSLVTTPTRVEK